ncbi:MAG: glycerol-3-phosphate 1-O-acyltransferase PlsY [Alphaproteobacteria bacterium]
MCASDCIYLVVVSYLLGSIPFGLVLARAFGLPDPRSIGSGNIGATNMLRTGRTDVAVLTLLFDAGKGAAAVWVGRLFFEATPMMEAVSITMATLGHIYSPWLKFRGGKGVATTLGGMLALAPMLGFMLAAIWLLVFVSTGISSLSSIAMLTFLPLLGWWEFAPLTVLVLAFGAVISIYKHLSNIQRLMRGDEPRLFGEKRKVRIVRDRE